MKGSPEQFLRIKISKRAHIVPYQLLISNKNGAIVYVKGENAKMVSVKKKQKTHFLNMIKTYNISK